ncbi:MAG: tetratricopeptide repeat protein [Magnetococcales bacterium]|nr:tetratricopeptide repeat protein [Magnetococcales bacterium]
MLGLLGGWPQATLGAGHGEESFAQGLDARREGRLEESLELFSRALLGRGLDRSAQAQVHLQRCAVQRELARQRKQEGVLERGLEDCSRAIALKPDLAPAYLERGLAKGDRGDWQAAAEDLTVATALDPDDPEAHHRLAEILERQERYPEALGACNRLIALRPAFAPAYRQRGRLHQHLGKDDAALRDYDMALRLDPRDGDARMARAALRVARGEDSEALADLDQALRQQPDNLEILQRRGYLRAATGDVARGRADLEQVLRARPRDYSLAVHRGLIDFMEGEFSRAEGWFGQAMELAPGHPIVALWLGLARLRQGMAVAPDALLGDADDDGQAPRDWPRTMAALLGGRLTPDQALAEVRSQPGGGDPLKVAESLFFAGQRMILAGAAPQAARWLAEGAEQGRSDPLLRRMALRDLERVRAGGPVLTASRKAAPGPVPVAAAVPSPAKAPVQARTKTEAPAGTVAAALPVRPWPLGVDPDHHAILLLSFPAENRDRIGPFLRRNGLEATGKQVYFFATRKGHVLVYLGDFPTLAAAKARLQELTPALREGQPRIQRIGPLRQWLASIVQPPWPEEWLQ